MDKNQKLIFLWCAFPAAGIGIALSYFFALKNDYEADVGYFASGSVPFLILTLLSALCAVCAVVLFFVFRTKYVIAEKPKQSPLTIFGLVLAIIMCIGIFISETGIINGFKDVSVPSAISAALTPAIAALLALSYLSSHREGSREKSDLIAVVMGIIAIASVVVKLFAEYFDFSRPINGHVRILTMVMQAFALLFIISETRLCFKPDSEKATSGFYVMASALAGSITIGLALGGILFTVFCPKDSNPNTTVMRLALCAAIGIIAVDRLTASAKITAEKPRPEK